MNKPDKIILHHSVTDEGTFESIKKYHVEVKGWHDIGYHYLITKDGKLHKGREESTVGAHTLGENHRSIGICLVGNFDLYEPNHEQIKGLYTLVSYIFNKYGELSLFGHSEFSPKTCPGTKFPMNEFKRTMSNQKEKQEISDWGKEAHEWIVKEGISDGANPRKPVTREQLWTMLYRYYEKYRK